MNPQSVTPLQAVPLLLFGFLVLGFGWLVYARVLRHLQSSGGLVEAGWAQLPEVLVATVLATFFGGSVLRSVLQRGGQPEPELSGDQILPSALLFLAFVAGLSAFLTFRRHQVGRIFGIQRESPIVVVGWAALMLLAAFPFVGLANAISVSSLGGAAAEQGLVRLFRSAAERADFALVGKVVLAGVIVAPVCEEFLFRGFFYGVAKRIAGPWVSGFVTALLFAAFHANLASLPGLFLLAVAFTIAYERTGSLLVPMTMHAFFNATSLSILYLQGAGAATP